MKPLNAILLFTGIFALGAIGTIIFVVVNRKVKAGKVEQTPEEMRVTANAKKTRKIKIIYKKA